jgi:hypothetical protein
MKLTVYRLAFEFPLAGVVVLGVSASGEASALEGCRFVTCLAKGAHWGPSMLLGVEASSLTY